MALIDVGTQEMNRRSRARGMTYLHSASLDNAQRGVLTSWGKGHVGRMDEFLAATKAHEQGVNQGIRGQKIQARGIKREEIAPRTNPQMKLTGSLN